MAKGDKFYFENFVACTKYAQEAAHYLVKCLENYEPENIEKMLTEMHEIEHKADVKKHEMHEALVRAFVTPVDRDDLDMLSHNLDHVVDAIEEIMQKFYIYNIKTMDSGVVEFGKKLIECTELMEELMEEFENFKKSKKIRELIIKLNDIEEECDSLYLTSMRKLTANTDNAFLTYSWCKIYECFEACADACENVSECVATVIMKNT